MDAYGQDGKLCRNHIQNHTSYYRIPWYINSNKMTFKSTLLPIPPSIFNAVRIQQDLLNSEICVRIVVWKPPHASNLAQDLDVFCKETEKKNLGKKKEKCHDLRQEIHVCRVLSEFRKRSPNQRNLYTKYTFGAGGHLL